MIKINIVQNFSSGIYTIPVYNSPTHLPEEYVGRTCRNISNRLKEQREDISKARHSTALVSRSYVVQLIDYITRLNYRLMHINWYSAKVIRLHFNLTLHEFIC